jgi:hypothetical protein
LSEFGVGPATADQGVYLSRAVADSPRQGQGPLEVVHGRPMVTFAQPGVGHQGMHLDLSQLVPGVLRQPLRPGEMLVGIDRAAAVPHR